MLTTEVEADTLTSPPASTTSTVGERPSAASDASACSAACWPRASVPCQVPNQPCFGASRNSSPVVLPAGVAGTPALDGCQSQTPTE